MGDFQYLKQSAEQLLAFDPKKCGSRDEHYKLQTLYSMAFSEQATPETVLKLLAECERLKRFEDWFAQLDQVQQSLAETFRIERDEAKEALRLHRLLTGIRAQQVVDELMALRTDVRRLKILAGEPVPPLAEEFIGPRPESIHDRLRRKLAGGGENAPKSTETRADQGVDGGAQ